MGIRDEIRSKSAALVKRERITLPECGVEVQVRSLMSGEAQRAGESKRSGDVQVAIGTEDPETGQPIWNPNSREDLDEIAGLHAVDKAVLMKAINDLSGMERLGKLFSPSAGNGSSSLPSLSAEPSGS